MNSEVPEKTSEGGTAVISVENLKKTFGGLVAVDGVSFDVDRGSITGLIGPNGAGKTTVFNLLTGVHRPDSGTIKLKGEDVQNLAPNEIAARGVGRTFQTPRVFKGMTVRENLAFAARGQTGETITGSLLRRHKVDEEEKEINQRVDDTLSFLTIDHLADEYARGLSGGQRKLLELGRVLMTEPGVILLDEPVAGINPALADELLERLHELNDEGKTLVLIEHDMDVVMNHCDHVVVLHNGKTLTTGPPKVVREDPRVIEAYLGGGLDG